MRNYEVTFIVDPVLSGDEIKATAQAYEDQIKNENCEIVHVDEMGLRQLAYPINKRSSGIYYTIEFQTETGAVIDKLELAFRRDERIMRFLSIKLDKYGVKFNDDKRKGLIGKKKKKVSADVETSKADKSKSSSEKKEIKKSPVKAEALKTQAAMSLAKSPVTEVAGEEEE